MTEDATFIVRKLNTLTALITASGGGLSNKVPYTGATQSVDLGNFFLTTSRILGGTAANSSIDFYSTSGAGTGTAFTFRGGTNGATTILTMLNDGTIRIPNNRQFQGTDSAGTNRAIFTWSGGDNITFTGRPGVSDIVLNPTSSGTGLTVKSGGDVGIGTASPSARLHLIKTTEQLRVGYDTSNYLSYTVSSTGVMTVTAVGTDPSLKLLSATTQKFSVWNATPDVQPTTAIVAGAFVANTSGTLNDTATYGGYTIGQVVAALKRIGALA